MTFQKEELKRLYKDQSLSTYEIAAHYKVGSETVRKALIGFGIKRRKRGPVRSFNPPKGELEKLYQAKSMRQIADHYGVGEVVVWKRLQEHGIKLRGFEEGGHRSKTGKTFSKEHVKNMSLSRIGKRAGDKHHNWKGGIAAANFFARGSTAYRQWKKDALERAGNKCEGCSVEQGFICPCCGVQIGLHVHHVKSFSKYPDLRFDPKNSEVLCPRCHRSRHN